jgi:mono/diheme cytochrome c family protein
VVNGYGSTGLGISRLNPALVTYSLDGAGRPADEGSAVFLATAPIAEFTFSGTLPIFRSYPTSVTASPSSREWLVTMESSDAVLVVSTRPKPKDVFGGTTMVMSEPDLACSTTGGGGGCGPSEPFTSPEAGGFEVRGAAVVTTGAGPKGVVFSAQDRAVVHDWLDRAVENLPYELAKDSVRDANEGGFPNNLFSARGFQRVAVAALPEEVEEGRRLFFSAMDERVSAPGAGVSCSTCHMDGRNDGFTWTLRGEHRNTPSLAGPVGRTAPVTWSEDVESVAEEALLTSDLRMGGSGLAEEDALAMEAFIDSTRYPDAPRRGEDSEQVRLGAEVFARADVGCASCHSGELFTDNLSHLVVGEKATQTPTLRGISASGPYFHDGSAPSLEAVVEMARSARMGDTSGLTDEERRALVAYLQSL